MGKGRKKKVPYFAEKEEQAVINYNLSDSWTEKNRIYNNVLKEPFRKMIQSILRRYPVHIGNYTMEEVEAYALSHLVEQMIKYKPFIIEYKKNDKWVKMGGEGRFIFLDEAEAEIESLNENETGKKYRLFKSKAYSYCQTIVRNYFKDHSKKTYNDKKAILCFDDYVDEINQNREYNYELEDEKDKLETLIEIIVDKIREKIKDDSNIKENEIIVGEAIINILENWEVLFMEETPTGKYDKKVTNKYRKNKILFFLKEQTGLNTKEIRVAIKPFKDVYYLEKNMLFDD